MPDGDIALKLPTMRVAYEGGTLGESELLPTWHEQLQRWLDEAASQGLPDANAMVLATAGSDGMPSSRTVLAKGLDERGVVFFTNYTSAKSHDLLATRYASATFPWYGLQRQVTVRGTVEKVRSAETAAYWAQRPRGSQLGAWASPQSIVVSGRGTLESALANVERQFADAETIPVPPHWGGWRIQPETVEFWQGRADRMHDRLRFKNTRGGWKVERLGP
ncbi:MULTISPECIES: pyridoxamine 5'-phosphate oxidase [Actinokineospora]|uniref:pyridoxamine 5'-phosphate oxidase n=1 Tax=Actinokineospora TaxID=39845 RepID=UPI000D70DBFF|nr:MULTISPECIES: pyridoxamine 5'-phosphate oxidase [Actinokineospora]MCG8917465.1 pyridoxamine 5'-phosphate oxidase [Actinokineospora sp. PR83]PWW65699.1 pyridoxamine 5'-phosphate oxidase [Actinokineospora spheciospongiae]